MFHISIQGDDKSSEFSQAKFDMSSFIGGIILVLCLQAGGFFAMRFLKSKEQSNYDPMWVEFVREPQCLCHWMQQPLVAEMIHTRSPQTTFTFSTSS